jgi:hypothetical protein
LPQYWQVACPARASMFTFAPQDLQVSVVMGSPDSEIGLMETPFLSCPGLFRKRKDDRRPRSFTALGGDCVLPGYTRNRLYAAHLPINPAGSEYHY